MHLFLLYILLILPPLTVSRPQCTKLTVSQSRSESINVETHQRIISNIFKTHLGPSQTLCFQFNSSEYVYSVDYLRLEHHHPIREEYVFGIPLVRTECVCDCPGGESLCSSKLPHGNCTMDSVCYTSLSSHQPPYGCAQGQEAQLCCKIGLKPYKNLLFTALNIGPPNPVAVLRFKKFKAGNGTKWPTVEEFKISAGLHSDKSLLMGDKKIEMRIGGQNEPSIQPGMYFKNNQDNQLYAGVPLNSQTEWSFSKLGWFRRSAKGWFVKEGWINVPSTHHATVEDCKAQKYYDGFTAKYLLRDTETELKIGKSIEELYPYISKSKVSERQIVVTSASGQSLDFELITDEKNKLQFLYHQAKLGDFEGSIRVDKDSNRFLNVTFKHSRGKINGAMFSSMRRTQPIPLNIFIGANNQLIPIPSHVNSAKFVCLYPEEFPEKEKCKMVKFVETPLEIVELPDEWKENISECPGCNESGFSNLLQYFNPAKWLDGFDSLTEVLAFGVELCVYIVCILIILCIVRRCILLHRFRKYSHSAILTII